MPFIAPGSECNAERLTETDKPVAALDQKDAPAPDDNSGYPDTHQIARSRSRKNPKR